MNASDIGRALGKLGLGRKKTMTADAIRQRVEAAKISAHKRKGRKRVRSIQVPCQVIETAENK